MSEQEVPSRNFGRRHPVLLAVDVVFVAGFLLGGLNGAWLQGSALRAAAAFVVGGLLAGIVGVVLFVLLSVILALPFTVGQVIIRALRSRSVAVENQENSFGRRFMRNLEGAMEFWLQGWS